MHMRSCMSTKRTLWAAFAESDLQIAESLVGTPPCTFDSLNTIVGECGRGGAESGGLQHTCEWQEWARRFQDLQEELERQVCSAIEPEQTEIVARVRVKFRKILSRRP